MINISWHSCEIILFQEFTDRNRWDFCRAPLAIRKFPCVFEKEISFPRALNFAHGHVQQTHFQVRPRVHKNGGPFNAYARRIRNGKDAIHTARQEHDFLNNPHLT